MVKNVYQRQGMDWLVHCFQFVLISVKRRLALRHEAQQNVFLFEHLPNTQAGRFRSRITLLF